MNKLKIILKDALILFAVSTAFVVPINYLFQGLKGKSSETDPVVTAIVQGKTDELKKIIEQRIKKKGNVNMVDEHGRTTLMRVAYANFSSSEKCAETDEDRAKMIPLLVDFGVPIDARDRDGWTALMWASWSDLPKVAGQLLDHNASPAPADKIGNTALMLAAERGNVDIARQLLAKGADKAAANKKGESALDLAKEGTAKYPKKKDGYQEIITLLDSVPKGFGR